MNRVLRVYIAYEIFDYHKITHLPGENKVSNTWQKHGVILVDVTDVLVEEPKLEGVLVVTWLDCDVPVEATVEHK